MICFPAPSLLDKGADIYESLSTSRKNIDVMWKAPWGSERKRARFRHSLSRFADGLA